MSVSVVSFGCRLNAAESDTLADQARAAGLRDVVVVNSCAVTAKASRDARAAVRRAAREHPDARVIVTGCASAVDRAGFAAMPEIAAVVPNADKTRPETWARLAGVAPPPPGPDIPARTVPRVRAFLQVQTGCDHRCTFCIIPFGRGASRSIPVADVVAATRSLVAEGAREVVLTGVDATSYGADLPGAPRLGTLVRAVLAGVPELDRLRLSSIDSVEADPELLDAFATEARLMPHLHLSLQAGDDLVLKRMKRRHDRADAIRFCAELRSLRPDMVFGADLIAGFPTETEAMFARSLDLVVECGLTHLHVFPFSQRPGTPAARMPPVPTPVVGERAARLRRAGDAALARHLAGEVGERRTVLVETDRTGRTEGFALVRFPGPMERGALVAATVAGHDGRELLAA